MSRRLMRGIDQSEKIKLKKTIWLDQNGLHEHLGTLL